MFVCLVVCLFVCLFVSLSINTTTANIKAHTGFPVGPKAPKCFARATSFSAPRPERRRGCVYGQAGNSMCVPVMGLLIMYICSHIHPSVFDRKVTSPSSGHNDAASAFAAMMLASKRPRG